MKKILFAIIFLCSFSYLVLCQTNTRTMNMRFEIAGFGYQIAPSEQVVYKQQMTGGTEYLPDGTERNWDGYEYIPCTDIDFKTTSLIFIGDAIMFKEFLPIPAKYIPSLKIIQQSIGYSKNYATILSPLENAVYNKYPNGVIARLDISGYAYNGQMIFKNKAGKLFFLCVGDSHLYEITIPIDETSLQLVFSNHCIGAYYTDKNGLYYFPTYNKQQQQLESSEGKLVQVVQHSRYFVYGDVAYPYGNNFLEDKKIMRLNANELYLINFGSNQYLGDNNKLFVLPSSFDTSIRSTSLIDVIKKGRPQEPVNKWNWFDFFVVGKDNLKGNKVYYANKNMNMSGSYYYLIKTTSGIYGINYNYPSEVVKYDNVMIYNIEKDDYEPIELEHFRRLTVNFYIYKNQIYDSRSLPVETELDIQKLQAIRLNEESTEFYTDGTFLVGGYNLGEKTIKQQGKQEWLQLKKMFRDVDWESLQIVNENVMVDKNNIYQTNSSLLEVIPIKDLGLDVKVIPFMNK